MIKAAFELSHVLAVHRPDQGTMEARRKVRPLTGLSVALLSVSSYRPVVVRADDTLNGVVSDAFGKIQTLTNVTQRIVSHSEECHPSATQEAYISWSNEGLAKPATRPTPVSPSSIPLCWEYVCIAGRSMK